MLIRLALPSDLPQVRDRLRAVFGPQRADHRLDPLSQLIRAILGVRTYDEVAWAAFIRLRAAYPDWTALGEAEAEAVEQVIDPVTFADQKARQLPVVIRMIRLRRGDLDLGFLADETVEEAMSWLLRLPGVGAHAAAATLNLSTLGRRAMVVDAHVHRVARRLGLTGRQGDAARAHDDLLDLAPKGWDGEALAELHLLMKAHGQSICSHLDPACGLCALSEACPRVGVAGDQETSVVAYRPKPATGPELAR